MGEYVSRAEENEVRTLLDELAVKLGFVSDRKEACFNGFYLDRLWYSRLEKDLIPAVGFEIERSVPLNERVRKDVLNLTFSRAPVGYLIVPQRRILQDPQIKVGSTNQNWFANTFWKTFEAYKRPFSFYCEVRLVDIDLLKEKRSLTDATISLPARDGGTITTV